MIKGRLSGGSAFMELFQHTANLLTVIKTYHPQGLSLIEFFDQPIKGMVNSTLQTPSLIPLAST